MRRWPRDDQPVDRLGAGLLEIEVERGIGLRRRIGCGRAWRKESRPWSDSRCARPRAASRRARRRRPSAPRRRGAAAPADSRRARPSPPSGRARFSASLACRPVRKGMKNGSPYCWSPGCGCSMKATAWVAPRRRFRARLVRRVVELLRRGQHALPRLGIDVGAAVQRARHGADRDVQMAGEVADARRKDDLPSRRHRQ